jgi:hypothetical protein
MIGKCSCVICKKQYSGKGIHTHADRTHGDEETKAKYSSGYNGRYNDPEHMKNLKKSLKKFYDKELGPKKTYNVSCHKCGKDFDVTERENQFPSKEKYFCSATCRNTRSHTEATKQKIKKSLRKYNGPEKIYEKTCPWCSKIHTTKEKNKKFCSRDCATKHKSAEARKHRSAYKNYRADCEFRFNLKDYPEEFNFALIEEHGWYSAANRGNNLYGVSRDHIVSVKYGFENNIDPAIISHPANCQLMIHSDNVSKYTNNDLTIDQLLEKIEIWNNKYI